MHAQYKLKVLVVGGSQVGKGSLIERACRDRYPPEKGKRNGTKRLEVNSKCVEIELFNSPGLKRYRNLIRPLMKGNNAILILCDITHSTPIPYFQEWIEFIHQEVPKNTLIYLIGTKLDLESTRGFTWESMIEFASSNEFQYLEISAKENRNIEILFQHIACKSLDLPNSFLKTKSARSRMN